MRIALLISAAALSFACSSRPPQVNQHSEERFREGLLGYRRCMEASAVELSSSSASAAEIADAADARCGAEFGEHRRTSIDYAVAGFPPERRSQAQALGVALAEDTQIAMRKKAVGIVVEMRNPKAKRAERLPSKKLKLVPSDE